MNRREYLRAAAALGALGALRLPTALAQTPPGGVMTMIVPYPAGGASDVFARAMTPALGRILGRTVVVENISGASGSIAATRVLANKPRGETLLMASPTDVILAPALLKSVRYQASDFKLIGLVDKAPLTVFVRNGLPVRTVDELVAYMRRPGAVPLSYGTTGPGSFYHLVAEELQKTIGVTMTHAPYRGGAPLMQDLVGENIDMTLLPASVTASSMVTSGRIRAIGVMGSARAARLPDVQTFAESKTLSRFHALDMWAGVMVPQDTPAEVTQRLHAAMAQALADREVHAALSAAAAGVVPPMMSLAEAESFYRAQTASLVTAAKSASIQAQ
jgi:tripartite-type tricarboxylate transporter receptor subunit TctC